MNKAIKDISGLARSIIWFLVLLLLAVFILKTTFSRIKQQKKEIKENKLREMILREKEDVLRNFRPEVMDWADLSFLALPEDNSTLIVISQIKKLASKEEILVKNIDVQNSLDKKSGVLNKASLKIELEGLFPQLTEFVVSLENILPLVVVNEVRITDELGIAKAEVFLSTFWSDFPDRLPSITDPVVELTNKEISLLNELGVFDQPSFMELPPSSSSPRLDPFQ